MKKLKTNPLFAAAVVGALVFGPLAYAQDTAVTTGTSAPSNPSASPAVGPGGHGGHHHGERLEHLSEALGLTDAQKEQIKPILKSEFEQMKALKDDTTTDKEQKKEKFRSIRKASDEQIKAILTPEQVEKWKEMRKEHREEKHSGAAPITTGSAQ
jgi:Spy/CpxP family protein refolding chaperone